MLIAAERKEMSSPRLNHVAKQAQRRLIKARQAAIDATAGRQIQCEACGQQFTLTVAAYRGVALRDRVDVEAVRYACPHCGTEQAVHLEPPVTG
jgi:phage terminase large subunit GpA-like protein